MLYLGIDQHARQITISLRDENGDVLQARQVSTQPEKINAFFQQLTRERLPADTPFVAMSAPKTRTVASRSMAYGSGTQMAASGAENNPASSSDACTGRTVLASCHTPAGMNTSSGNRNTPVWRVEFIGFAYPPVMNRYAGSKKYQKSETRPVMLLKCLGWRSSKRADSTERWVAAPATGAAGGCP